MILLTGGSQGSTGDPRGLMCSQALKLESVKMFGEIDCREGIPLSDRWHWRCDWHRTAVVGRTGHRSRCQSGSESARRDHQTAQLRSEGKLLEPQWFEPKFD